MQSPYSHSDAKLLLSCVWYLAIPNFIFLAGWVKPSLAFISITLLGFVLCWETQKNLCQKPPSMKNEKYSLFYLAVFFLIFCFWTGISGIGGFGYQNTDYEASNALFHDLITKDWPLQYEYQGKSYFLVYYFAYYLPAALVGKILGWHAANYAIFLWSFFGIWLAFMLFVRLVDAQKYFAIFAAFAFCLLGGLDIVGKIGMDAFPPWGEHIERWSVYFQYSSQSTLLFWVPQQAIAGWILAGVSFFYFTKSACPRLLCLCCVLSILFSPFSLVGLFPYFILQMIQYLRSQGIKPLCTLSNLIACPLLCFIFGSFILSNPLSFPKEFMYHRHEFLNQYFSFILFEVMPLGILYYWLLYPREKQHRVWFWTTISILLILPWIRVGFSNDLVRRASIPALFFLYVFFLRTIQHSQGRKKVVRAILFFGFLLATSASLFEITRSFQNFSFSPPEEKNIKTHLDLPHRDIKQRMGDPQSLFFQFLARPKKSQK
ncbi:MAG: hypothetical protein HUU50_04515 [Candidatus Brocadiae bacterium]|nr:hypothetical protein [Candidatus Brocadiia bacterium]